MVLGIAQFDFAVFDPDICGFLGAGRTEATFCTELTRREVLVLSDMIPGKESQGRETLMEY